MRKVEKLAFFGIGETNSPDWIWIVATKLTDNPFGNRLYGKLKERRASYWRHGNTPLPGKMKYNTQFCDYPTIQHFMWGGLIRVEVRKQQRIRIRRSTR